jgi:hypothetical protein
VNDAGGHSWYEQMHGAAGNAGEGHQVFIMHMLAQFLHPDNGLLAQLFFDRFLYVLGSIGVDDYSGSIKPLTDGTAVYINKRAGIWMTPVVNSDFNKAIPTPNSRAGVDIGTALGRAWLDKVRHQRLECGPDEPEAALSIDTDNIMEAQSSRISKCCRRPRPRGRDAYNGLQWLLFMADIFRRDSEGAHHRT